MRIAPPDANLHRLITKRSPVPQRLPALPSQELCLQLTQLALKIMDKNYDSMLFDLFEKTIKGAITPEEALSLVVTPNMRADLLEIFRRRGVPQGANYE